MAKKKQHVLWVVHTDTTATVGKYYEETIKELDEAGSHISQKLPWTPGEISQLEKDRADRKKIDRLHIEGVINSMRTAQEAGIKVVYEKGAHSDVFLELAERRGARSDEIIKMHRFEGPMGGEAVEEFLKILHSHGIEDFEVIFAGFWADACISYRAKALHNRGFKPYLIIGTVVGYFRRDKIKKTKELFGKDRLITIPQLRKL